LSARTIAIGCLASASFVAGCASGDATLTLPESSSTTATAATDPRTFTESPTTTTRTTTTTSTTTSTTNSTTTTVTPVTSPPMSANDQIRADFLSDRTTRLQCSYTPLNCDFASFSVPGSPVDVSTRAKIAERIADNLRAVPGHGDVLVRVDDSTVADTTGTVTACTYDTVVIYDIADPANPADDIIFDDSTTSLLVRWDMRLVKGRWLMFASTELKGMDGVDLCGF